MPFVGATAVPAKRAGETVAPDDLFLRGVGRICKREAHGLGPDGSLYVSSDQLAGRIFRVLYTGR